MGSGDLPDRPSARGDLPDRPSTGGGPRLVRPYLLTAGRTDPQVGVPVEAVLETVPQITADTTAASAELPARPAPPREVRSQIIEACRRRPSVAEVAAELDLPLGVVRVLVADLVSAGRLRVHATIGQDSSAAQRRDLIGRTLRGLRAL